MELSPVLKSALRLFSRYGYDSVSVEEIEEDAAAQAPGPSQFPDKTSLLAGILDAASQILPHSAPVGEEVLRLLQIETPWEVLFHHIRDCHFSGQSPATELCRFLFAEYHCLPQARKAVDRFLIETSAVQIQQTLDLMVERMVIPPCDSWAISRLWCHTALTYDMLSAHPDSLVSYQEYYLLCQLFIKMAVLGVMPPELPPLPRCAPAVSGGAPPQGPDNCGEGRLEQLLTAAGVPSGSPEHSPFQVTKELFAEVLSLHDRFSTEHLRVEISAAELPLILKRLFANSVHWGNPHSLCSLRLLHSKQYQDETLKDYLEGTLFRCHSALARSLEHLCERAGLPRCEAQKIAMAVVFSGYSMTMQALSGNENLSAAAQDCQRMHSLLIGLVLGGYTEGPAHWRIGNKYA